MRILQRLRQRPLMTAWAEAVFGALLLAIFIGLMGAIVLMAR